MRSCTPDSGVGLTRPSLGKGILVFLLWPNLLFLSHFNFLQLVMCQDGIRGYKRYLLQMDLRGSLKKKADVI
jgi:hypothetical protein